MGLQLRHQASLLRGVISPGVLAAAGLVVMLGGNPGTARAECNALSVRQYQGSEPYGDLPADLARLEIYLYDETPTGVAPIVGPGGEVGPQNGIPITLTVNSVPRVVILPESEWYEGTYSLDLRLTPRSVPRDLPPGNQVPDGDVSFAIDYEDGDCPDPIDASGQFSFPPRNVHVADYTVVDYGDGDGFADPGEILDLFPRIVNHLGYDLTGLRAVASSEDAGIEIVRGEAEYGGLAAGGETSTPATGPIRLRVTGDTEGGPRWPFRILLHGEQFAGPSGGGALTLARNRDAASDPGPGPDFLENFDSPAAGGDGLTDFQWGPLFPVNTEALVDGSRCQASAVLEFPRNPGRCRPWKGSDWHLDTHTTAYPTVARTGDGALHMGRHVPSVLPGAQTNLRDVTWGQLSAAVSPPIALGLGPVPTLEFWQIASLQQTEAGGVLQVSTDGGFSWTTVHEMPINGPSDPAIDKPSAFYTPPRGCSFDPFDDGSTEDDRFEPPDPLDGLFGFGPSGPSSVCRGRVERPVHTWGFVGDAEFWDGIRFGSEQTPALTGNTGGAWARSVANLQGYRGETVLLRFLVSTTNQNFATNPDATTGFGWSNVSFLLDPGPFYFTRGWFLDEVRVTGTAAAPVSLGEDLEPPPPPAVVSVDPAAEAEEVALLPTVTLSFSQPMDTGTLSADTLTLTGPLGRVEASRAVLQDGLGASLVPAANLLEGTTYVIDAGAGLRNIADVALVPFSSSFTTAPLRATDPSRAHPPADAEVSGFAVPAAIDIDQVSLRIASLDLGGGAEEAVLEAEVRLADGGIGFDADSTITVHLDFGEEGLGSIGVEPGLSDTQDVSLSVRFRSPTSNRRASRSPVDASAPVPRFSGFTGLGSLSSAAPGRIIFRVRLADLLAAATDQQRAAAAAAGDGTLTLRAWAASRLRGDQDHMPDTDDNESPSVASETLALRFAAP